MANLIDMQTNDDDDDEEWKSRLRMPAPDERYKTEDVRALE